MYRFLWRPAWVLSHLLVLALVVAMVNLGLWQLRRLDEKRDRNAQIEENSALDPLGLGEAAALVGTDGAAALRDRQVALAGSWDPGGEVAIRSRTLDGAPGRWVATPFRPGGGGPAVLVVRGWIPQSIDDTQPPFEEVAPAAGPVTILGSLQPTQERGNFGSVDPDEGVLGELSRVDVDRFGAQYPLPVVPFWLQLVEQSPPAAEPPTILPPPDLDEGPHLSYAVQWGIFTLIALVGYPLVLRRVARQRSAGRTGDPDDPDDPDRPGGRPAPSEAPAGG